MNAVPAGAGSGNCLLELDAQMHAMQVDDNITSRWAGLGLAACPPD